MAYCTQTDITARIPTLNLAQLTNDTANATTVDSTVLAALIAAADAEIDVILCDRFTVPFASTPARVRDISVTITIYHAMARRFGVMDVPQGWADAYKAAKEELAAFAAGEQTLPGVTPGTVDDVAVTAPVRQVDFDDADNPMSYF